MYSVIQLTQILVLSQLTTKIVSGNSAVLVPSLGTPNQSRSDGRRCVDVCVFLSGNVIPTAGTPGLL